jgi:hypothetical protein
MRQVRSVTLRGHGRSLDQRLEEWAVPIKASGVTVE